MSQDAREGERRGWLKRLLGPPPQSPPDGPLPASGSFEAVGPHYDTLMSRVPYREWVEYVQAIIERFGPEPETILDLACGTGQVGAELVRRGYTRTFGVDLAEGMVRICAHRGRLRAAVQDARALGLKPASFDLAVCLYDSLNYITEPSGLGRALTGVYDCLRPGGTFIFDLNTIRALELNLFTQDNLRSREPLLYRWRSRWDAEARICTVDMWFRWRGDDVDEEFVEIHRQRGYEDHEVRGLLRRVGFEILGVYDAYSFDPLNARSTRVFYVARRP